MGYMGFGMRKEVYTRKPKTAFKKLKAIYGDHLEDLKIKSKNQVSPLSEADKQYLKEKVKRELMEESVYNFLIFAGTLIICILAFYFAFKIIN